MKISYNWLREYIDTRLDVTEISEVLTAIGLEVESVEKVEAVPGGLQGIVIGEVMECERHPDADRLSLTKVNLGNGEPVQIVCGAPNVAKGQKVLVATIGAKLHPTEGEPFVIKKGKIRGQESVGMICAEDELGLGKSHDGIMVLNESAIVGQPAAEYLQLAGDHCIEIGLTPNRTDAFSHFGVARDLYAAIRNMEGIKKDTPVLKKPVLSALHSSESASKISVEVHGVEACPRYSGITISGIKVGESPKWLRDRLVVIGLRPINNIVDITNYVQHEIGQPLHAFDAAKIGGDKVVVRFANDAETFTTLDGVERKLSIEDLMICDSEKPMCIAGVFGGLESGVTESTTSIFLESAHFNSVFVRKTAKRHGLHTDASFRFERGCDPSVTIWALQRAAQLIAEIAGGKINSAITDIYPLELKPFAVEYDWQRATSLIGKEIGKDKVKSILGDLEIEIVSEKDEGLQLSVPLFRNDVMREADIVEEVLRIYGYDQIEAPKGLRTSISIAPKLNVEKLQERIASLFAARGFSEMMSMSLTRMKYRDLMMDESTANAAVEILNPLSGDLGMMRQTLLFNGLEAIRHNKNFRNGDLRLFEFGKIYSVYNSKYIEEKRLSVFLTGSKSPESWNNAQADVMFSDLRGEIENMLHSLTIRSFTFSNLSHPHYQGGVECYAGKMLLARLGIASSNILKEFDLSGQILMADVLWENVIKSIPMSRIPYKEASKFPAVRRDLSMLLSKGTSYAEIERLAFETERKLLKSVNLFDVYEGKNLEEGKKSYAVSFMLQDDLKTMTDQQVDVVMGRIQKSLEEKLGATLRS